MIYVNQELGKDDAVCTQLSFSKPCGSRAQSRVKGCPYVSRLPSITMPKCARYDLGKRIFSMLPLTSICSFPADNVS